MNTILIEINNSNLFTKLIIIFDSRMFKYKKLDYSNRWTISILYERI